MSARIFEKRAVPGHVEALLFRNLKHGLNNCRLAETDAIDASSIVDEVRSVNPTCAAHWSRAVEFMPSWEEVPWGFS